MAMPRNAAKAEAIATGLKHYFTGRPCKRGHIALRPVKTGMCSVCSAENSQQYREEFGDKHRACSRAWYQKNIERARAKSKWYHDNLDPEEKRRVRREWKKANRAYCTFESRTGAQARRKRLPAWAALDAIREFYEVAAEMTAKTGEQWHVDHVIPLRGKLVSGLHVHTNLQLLTAQENLRKHAKFAA